MSVYLLIFMFSVEPEWLFEDSFSWYFFHSECFAVLSCDFRNSHDFQYLDNTLLHDNIFRLVINNSAHPYSWSMPVCFPRTVLNNKNVIRNDQFNLFLSCTFHSILKNCFRRHWHFLLFLNCTIVEIGFGRSVAPQHVCITFSKALSHSTKIGDWFFLHHSFILSLKNF